MADERALPLFFAGIWFSNNAISLIHAQDGIRRLFFPAGVTSRFKKSARDVAFAMEDAHNENHIVGDIVAIEDHVRADVPHTCALTIF